MFHPDAPSFSFLRSLAEQNDLVVFAYGLASGQFTYLNPAFEQVFARTQESLRTSAELPALVHPQDLPYLEQAYGALLAGEIRENVEFRILLPDGSVKWLRVKPYVLEEAPGERILAGTGEDITERKRHGANLAFLAEISQDLVRLTRIDETMAVLGAKIGAFFGLSRCLFVEIDPAQELCWVSYGWGREGAVEIPGKHRIADFISPRFQVASRAGETVVINDVFADPRTGGEQYRAFGIGAMVTVPLLRGDDWYFLLGFYDARPRDWQAGELELMRELTTRIWSRIERARAQEALEESEAKYRTLFETIDEGFTIQELLLDEKGKVTDVMYREVNKAYGQHSGLKDALGKKASELFPHLEQHWLDSMTQVYQTGEPVRREGYQADLDRWFTLQYARVGGPGSRFISVVFQDITGRKRQEQRQAYRLKLSDALGSRSDAIAIEEAVTAEALRYFQADRCYYCTIEEGSAIIRRDASGNGLHSIAGTYRLDQFDLFNVVLETGLPFIVNDVHESELVNDALLSLLLRVDIGSFLNVPVVKAGKVAGVFTVAQSASRTWTELEVELAVETADRTWASVERARTEEALRNSEAQLRAVFKALPVGIGFADPKGQLLLSNEEMRLYLPHNIMPSQEDNLYPHWLAHHPDGTRVGREGFPGARALRGEYVVPGMEMLYHPPEGARIWTRVAAVPIGDPDGNTIGAVTVVTDITGLKQATEALREREERLQKALSIQTVGVIFFDPAGNIQDANPAFCRMSGYAREDLAGGKVHWKQLTPPEFREASRIAQQELLTQGENTPYEKQYIRPDGSRWWGLFAGKRLSETECVEFVVDITRQKEYEQHLQDFNTLLEQKVKARTEELQESKDLLQSVFDTSLISLSVLKAERDEAGNIQDFRIRMVNKELERETGRRDLVGKRYAREFSGIKEAGLFEVMLRVMQTGKPEGMEYHYPFEGLNKWYSALFVKLDDGLVATNLDITERKGAEQELLKNYHILRQAEALACLGSWEYDVKSGQITWSAGMYRLFGLPEDAPIRPEIYLDYALAEDRSIAHKIVQALRESHRPLEETLRMHINGKTCTVKIQAQRLSNQSGQPEKILGVDLDISEIKRLEEENIRIRLEQHNQLLNAILEAQEEERRRISESLHNGVGQILFATKLNLVGVDLQAPPERKEQVAQALRKVEALLTEAIEETRRASHELVPILLKDFGLQKAIDEFCRRFQGTGIELSCHYFAERLAAPLETAIYRISQELLNNIVRHSGATKASLEVNKDQQFVYLDAQDNGKGLDLNRLQEPDARTGIGLRTIQDRVKLLNGEIDLESRPGKGTLVSIKIPLDRSESKPKALDLK
ncbi:MAG: Chemotaxis protein methyltransferase CheR [uncultured Cytophagales bacterium]|uniref:Oxygen sensor histidine kinase NreB n=1 Tax=uncultured Cytophagales bacterium TaxID=158755 RepID=A0A6J4KED4_9SPHI|nr:MAG: Chemotaxis protein methyltransferase CheR [uncultured Cytophagales bacterium]